MTTIHAERLRRDEMKAMVDSLVSPLLVRHPHLGLVVGLLEADRAVVYGYGLLDKTRLIVPHERTLFEIGSITKVFTAILLATMVEEGRVSLDEPLCSLLPECAHLPQEITLLRLATHTSGLPRLPANLFEAPGFNARNPYAHYTSTHLYAYLATHRGNTTGTQPGTYAYSNLGAGLLGDVLARTLGLSYEQAIVQRICDPLGMPDTRSLLTAEQQERLAPPHTPTGEPTLNWNFPALAGAGGLRSTAQDVLTFLAANLGKVTPPLQPALRLCHEIVVDRPLPQSNLTGIALGWHVIRLTKSGKAMYWHNGGTGGYRAFAGFQMESQRGVVICSNYGYGSETNIDPIGATLLDQFSHRAETSGL